MLLIAAHASRSVCAPLLSRAKPAPRAWVHERARQLMRLLFVLRLRLCQITKLTATLKRLDPRDSTRIELTDQLLNK